MIKTSAGSPRARRMGIAPFVSPIDGHSAVWSVSFREPNPREPIQGDDAVKAKDEILNEARERGKAFVEPFQTFVAHTDPKTLHIFNAMDKQPIDHSELTNKSVVFVGDSNSSCLITVPENHDFKYVVMPMRI